jgi:hypothetical protein
MLRIFLDDDERGQLLIAAMNGAQPRHPMAIFTESQRLYNGQTRLNQAPRSMGPRAMTLIEIRPRRWGWEVFEAPGVQPVFPKKEQAIDYAQERARFSYRRDSCFRFERHA